MNDLKPEPELLIEHVRDELRQHAECPIDRWGSPGAIARWLSIQAENLSEALERLSQGAVGRYGGLERKYYALRRENEALRQRVGDVMGELWERADINDPSTFDYADWANQLGIALGCERRVTDGDGRVERRHP